MVVTCVPLALIAVLCRAAVGGGPLLERLLETQFPLGTGARLRVAGLVTVGAVIAGAATWIVLAEAGSPPAALRRLLAAVLVVDLVLFNLLRDQPADHRGHGPGQRPRWRPRSPPTVGDGRFIIYDPDQFETDQLYALGQTDLNIYTGCPAPRATRR